MLQSESSFLGNKSVPWDTGCARRFLLISDEQKKILESIPGWSVEETEQSKDPISESEKSSKISEQPSATAIAGTGDIVRGTCNPLILNLNPITKESDGLNSNLSSKEKSTTALSFDLNSKLPPKENLTKKNTFMQSISLYANKVVHMFSRRRSNSLSDIGYAKFDNGLTHSKSETNLAEDDYKTFRNSADDMTFEKLDTHILNHPFLNGSETLVLPTTNGAASRDDLLNKRMELLEKRFSLPKESGSLLLTEEVGSRSNFGSTVCTEKETKKNGEPKGLVPEENSLLLHVEEIRKKINFGTTDEETGESGLSKGLAPTEISLSKGLAPKRNSLLSEEIRNEIDFETTVSKSETNLVSVTEGQGLGPQKQSLSLPDLVCDNNLNSSSNVLFDETSKVYIETVESHKSIENVSEVPLITITNSNNAIENSHANSNNDSLSKTVVADTKNSHSNSNNDYFSKTIVPDTENSYFNSCCLSKVIVADTENLHFHSNNDCSSKSIENISKVYPQDSGCKRNETNSMVLLDDDSLPSIESILSTKIQENQIQVLKSVTSKYLSQDCGKTTEETDDFQSCSVIPPKSFALQTDEKVSEHHDAEKRSMNVTDTENSCVNSNNDYLSNTIVPDTGKSHANSNYDFFSKIIVADTEKSQVNSNYDFFSKIVAADTENSQSNSNNVSKIIVDNTENSHSDSAIETYNSASAKLGGKRKRLSKDNRNSSNGDKSFVVVADTKVVEDTENSHSNCVLENYSAVMNNSGSGKLGGKRKRQSKDNDKPRKKSLVDSAVIIQYTANEVNNMIQLMKEFQKKM